MGLKQAPPKNETLMCVYVFPHLQNLKHHYQVMLEEKVRIKSDRDLFRGECEKLHSLCENLRKDKNQLLQELDQCRLQLRQVSSTQGGFCVLEVSFIWGFTVVV